MSVGINNGIRRSYDNGILTSTSLMMVGEAVDDAITCLNQRPGLGRGIHVALTDGEPITDSDAVETLVTDDGTFYSDGFTFYTNWFRGRIDPTHVRKEVNAQIALAMSRLDSVDHLNSHMHIHMIPKIYDIFDKYAKEYDIPYVRYSHERLPLTTRAITSGYLFRTIANPGIIKKFVLSILGAFTRRRSSIATDSFAGVVHVGNMTESVLTSLLESSAFPSTELCVHPGEYEENRQTSRKDLNAARENDLKGLTSERVISLAETNFDLITIREFAERNE